LIRGVFFDLDGTLVDSAGDLATASNAMLRDLGLPVRSLGEIRSFIGEGSRNLVERCIAPRLDLADEALSSWTRHYDRVLLETTVPYPGIAEVLGRLERRGLRLAVHTNKPSGMAGRILRGLDLEGRFSFILGSDDGPARKPSPEGAHFLFDRLELAPSETAYVGDSRIDAETARAAGSRFVGVSWGLRPREELVAAGASAVIDSPAELEAALDDGR
jgi:phosphoglycolate phosphatase